MATRDTLIQLHDRQINNGYNNDENQDSIIEILGGIDEILHSILRDTTSDLLQQHKMDALHQILMSHNNLTPMQYNNDTSLEDRKSTKPEWCYHFDDENTFLHSIFSENTANKILQILHGPIIKIVLVLAIIIWFGVGISTDFRAISQAISTLILDIFLIIPWLLCWLLSANKKATRLILTSFEFWFKLFYLFVYQFANVTDVFAINADNFESIEWKYVEIIISTVTSVIFYIVVVLFDAININKIWKFAISGALAAWWIAFAVGHRSSKFEANEEYFNSSITIKVYNGYDVNLNTRDIRLESLQVLAIFLAKQAIFTMFRSKKCALIRYTPFIKWNKNKQSIGEKTKKCFRVLTIAAWIFFVILLTMILMYWYFVLQYINGHDAIIGWRWKFTLMSVGTAICWISMPVAVYGIFREKMRYIYFGIGISGVMVLSLPVMNLAFGMTSGVLLVDLVWHIAVCSLFGLTIIVFSNVEYVFIVYNSSSCSNKTQQQQSRVVDDNDMKRDEAKLNDAINSCKGESLYDNDASNVEQIELNGTSIGTKTDKEESISSSCGSKSESDMP